MRRYALPYWANQIPLIIQLGYDVHLLDGGVMLAARETKDPETAAIKDVVLKTWGAWNSRVANNGVPYFRNAAEDMFFDYCPLRFDNFKEYMAGTQTYLNTLSAQGIKEKEIRVERVGNTAWVVGTYTVDSESNAGEHFHVEGGRYTGILVKVDSRWLVCHEHWSPPAPPAA